MHIHKFTRIVSAPFLAAFVYVFWSANQPLSNHKISVWLFPLGIILMLCYVFHNQIDLWWLKRHPVPLDDKDRKIVHEHSAYYRGLSPDDKLEFENRLFMVLQSKEFYSMGKEKETVPYDIQLIISLIGLEIAAQSDNPLLDNYDKIILYQHPFPTPTIKRLHTVETHGEDGVILMAMDHFGAAVNDPKSYYHVGYHAWAEAFVYEHPKLNYPVAISWSVISDICGFSEDSIKGALGLEYFDTLPIGIYLYFVFGDKMKMSYPELFKQFQVIFGRWS